MPVSKVMGKDFFQSVNAERFTAHRTPFTSTWGPRPRKLSGRNRKAGLSCRQSTEGRLLGVRCNCSASSFSQTAESDPQSQLENTQGLTTAKEWFYAFFKFTRPHTMLGTLVSIVSVSLLALVRFSALSYCIQHPAIIKPSPRNAAD